MITISIYFDEKSDKQIRNYINAVANATGNYFMTENNVPPHITIAAFETRNEHAARKAFHEIINDFSEGSINWVTVGSFGQSVIYVAPVLNEYLQNLSVRTYEVLQGKDDFVIDKKYKPFNWLPHATIGKTLTIEQQIKAFDTLQRHFVVSESNVIKIGLARTNPFHNLEFRSIR